MRLHVRHLSGSKAGVEQSFDPSAVRVGREPSNDIAFDPHQDIVVSGRHAEFAFDGRSWVVRDLGSSNGTFVGSSRITSHQLKSGESVQFGRGGPRLEIRLDQPAAQAVPTGSVEMAVDNPGTTVMSINDIVGGRRTAAERPLQAVPGDGTMMMGAADFAALAPAPSAAAHKPASNARTMRIVLLALLLVATAALFAIAALRSGKKTAPQETKQTPQQQPVDQQRADIRALEAKIAELQKQQTQSAGTGGVVSADLENQYRSAQDTIEALRRELEQKNDQLAAAENKPAQTIVKYVPVKVPAPAPATTNAQPPVSAPAATPQRTYETPAPQVASALAVSTQAPQPPPVTYSPRPATTQPAAPAPQQATTYSAPRSTTTSRPSPPPVAPPVTTASASRTSAWTPAPLPVPDRLVMTKEIKRRVSVTGSAADAVLVGASPSFGDELARVVSAGLVSSGKFIVDRSAANGVVLAVRSFRSEEKRADSSRAAGKASAIGSLLGVGRVNPPAQAKSVTYDAALSVQVTITDARGRELASSAPNAALNGRQSSVRVDGARLTGHDLAANETPTADVVRQVAAAAIDDAMRTLGGAQGDVTVKSMKDDLLLLDGGRNMNIAPDDTFDVLDGDQPVARVRIDAVQETTATARIVSGPRELAGRRARYVGTAIFNGAAEPAKKSVDRFGTVRAKTEAKKGPGKAFDAAATVAARTRVKHLYSVGGWSKLQNGNATYWVPTSAIDFE